MDISKKLEDHMKAIEYEQKKANGLLLNREDIHVIFKILKENDQEIENLLSIIETSLQTSQDYIFIEESVRSILKYYTILENDDLMNCRHKFFFTESRLVKKTFFGPSKLSDIKTELDVLGILHKLKGF